MDIKDKKLTLTRDIDPIHVVTVNNDKQTLILTMVFIMRVPELVQKVVTLNNDKQTLILVMVFIIL